MFIVSRRLYNAVVQAIFFVLLMTLIIPDQSIYARNVVSFVCRLVISQACTCELGYWRHHTDELRDEQCIFSVFIQALHYSREAVSPSALLGFQHFILIYPTDSIQPHPPCYPIHDPQLILAPCTFEYHTPNHTELPPNVRSQFAA